MHVVLSKYEWTCIVNVNVSIKMSLPLNLFMVYYCDINVIQTTGNCFMYSLPNTTIHVYEVRQGECMKHVPVIQTHGHVFVKLFIMLFYTQFIDAYIF